MGLLLCIETSCDDTSAALVRDQEVLASIVSSQHELHARFGGIVPEVASRRHTELLNDVVAEAMTRAAVGWDDLDAVAVTVGPGLIGALLVGLAAAKAIAWRLRMPLVPVDHLEGHIAAAYAVTSGDAVAGTPVGASAPGDDAAAVPEVAAGPPEASSEPSPEAAAPPPEPPFLCLVVSGGHTLLAVVEEGVRFRVAGRTLDDAAGEAFDKGARLLGLPYPGGRDLDRLAAGGHDGFARFPRVLPHGLDFSFSGLKTALLYYLREQSDELVERHRADIAASFQGAIVRQLVEKTVRCAESEGLRQVAVAGGVAANSGLRAALTDECRRRGLTLCLPAPALCTDNAAMIGLAAAHLEALPWPEYLALDAYAAAALAPARQGSRATVAAPRRPCPPAAEMPQPAFPRGSAAGGSPPPA
jgi:N6-L-threonylcarbamoyladenine synthase